MPRVEFRCLVGPDRARFGEQACSNEKPWTASAEAVEGGLYQEPALRVDPADAACPACGATGTAQAEEMVVVGAPPASVERCGSCGSVIPLSDARFCPSCGAALDG